MSKMRIELPNFMRILNSQTSNRSAEKIVNTISRGETKIEAKTNAPKGTIAFLVVLLIMELLTIKVDEPLIKFILIVVILAIGYVYLLYYENFLNDRES